MRVEDIQQAFARVDYRLELISQPLGHKQQMLAVLEVVSAGEITPALTELRDWLAGVVAAEMEEFEVPAKPGREVVQQQRRGGSLYQLEKVKCGKSACKSCPHGPYWYGYQRRGGKLRSWYIGKDITKELRQQSHGT